MGLTNQPLIVQPLLGATTLEDIGLVPDPCKRRRIPMRRWPA